MYIVQHLLFLYKSLLKPIVMEKPANLTLPKVQKNISDIERLISVLGGLYLLYDSFRKDKRSLPEIGAAGYMI